MSIRIRKSKQPAHGHGQLFVYRTKYVKATTVREVPVPGHQRDVYVAALSRFTLTGHAAKALAYHTPKEAPKPAPLTAAELAKLDAFLAEDIKNYRPVRDPALVAEIRAEVEAEWYREHAGQEQDPVLLAPDAIRAATFQIVERAKAYQAQKQTLLDGFLKPRNLYVAPADANELTQLKVQSNLIRLAADELETELKKLKLTLGKPESATKNKPAAKNKGGA